MSIADHWSVPRIETELVWLHGINSEEESMLRRMVGNAGKTAIATISRSLPFETAMWVAQRILADQGFGSGGHIASSGEQGVFSLIETPSPVLFDVGGHVGEYTEAFLATHVTGASYVFEPSSGHLAILRKRLGSAANVHVFPIALSSTSGNGVLYKDREVSGLASLTKRRLDHFGIAMELQEAVDVSTIDAVVEEQRITKIDLLKIDVEGHELDVLRGAEKCFANRLISLVQFEFGGCNIDTRVALQDFFYFFKKYDFAIGLVQPSGNIQVLDRYDEFYEQNRTTNFVAGPSDAIWAGRH